MTTSNSNLSDSDELEILRLSIRELTYKYRMINSIHDQMRVKSLALIAAIVGIATFIYTGTNVLPASNHDKLLFYFGSALLGGAFLALLWTLSTTDWHSPVEVKDIERAEKIYDSKIDYLKYIRNDYVIAVRGNAHTSSIRGKAVNHAMYALVVSVIILMVSRGH